MKDKINKEVLCVLKYVANEIIIDYVPIELYFQSELETLKELCESSSDNLIDIVKYLETTKSLSVLQKHYRYCRKLDGSFQAFSVNFEEKIKRIIENRDLFYLNAKNNSDYDIEERILVFQNEILEEFTLWVSAFSIEIAYRKCFMDKQILAFSHRIDGWSNPEYKLSNNFTVELKTNFGYGGASYFYIKLKYKNIEIIPFSEWIDYEAAKFSGIIRYSKSFCYKILKGIYNGKRVYKRIIKNSNWGDAMEFTKTACNISLKSEDDFIRKYIVEECEKMVNGLVDMLTISEFTFIGENNNHYKVDKSGHQLMEFRGEKISGALDFIKKILEFDRIIEIKSFITRIEYCNKMIQPLLVEEKKVIKVELNSLVSKMSILKPKYLILFEKNEKYTILKNEVRKQLIISKELNGRNFDFEKFNKIFLDKYPEFEEFKKEFDIVSDELKTLMEQIQNLTKLFENITTYNDKILLYFGKTST